MREKISMISKKKWIPRHECDILVQGIPRSTKLEFKAACARRNRTMRDVVIILMRQYIEEHLGKKK